MTAKDISLKIIEACKDSVELNDFILTKYAKSLTYSRGLNLDIDYFSEDEYADVPIIIIDPEKHSEQTDYGKVFSIVLHTKISHKDEFKNGFAKVDGVITLDGIDEIEEINRLVIIAIKDKFQSLLDIEDIESYLDALHHVSNYTEYNGHIVMTFTQESTIGGCST